LSSWGVSAIAAGRFFIITTAHGHPCTAIPAIVAIIGILGAPLARGIEQLLNAGPSTEIEQLRQLSDLQSMSRLAGIDPSDQRLPILRLLRTVVDNPLKAWPRALYHERVYRSRVLGQDTFYVMAPDLIRAVLVDEAESFEKGQVARRALGPALGDAILIADGSKWRWQRRAVAGIFRQDRIQNFLTTMLASAARTRDRWLAFRPGVEIDLSREMMRTTFDIILSTMLPKGSNVDVELMQRSITDYLEPTSWVIALNMIRAPDWVPYPGIYRAHRACRHLHKLLESLIGERRDGALSGNDLLSLLQKATDPETGRSMNSVDVRNNLLTFITAGHETTALALTWTFYLLSLHPGIEQRVKDEIASVAQGGPVQAKHIENLIYTNQVLQEAMRLYPPAALIVRAARRDVKLGDEHIKAGTTVYVPVYAVHRHERLWRDPNHFDPSRFDPEVGETRDRYAYLPFGAGPRICIGQSFAQKEAIAVLATLLGALQLRLRPGHRPEPRLRVTLRPKGGMPMQVARHS
jgi:cytochrome P450